MPLGFPDYFYPEMLPDLQFNMDGGLAEEERLLRAAEGKKWRALKEQFQLQLGADWELIKRTKSGASVLRVTSLDQITDAPPAYLFVQNQGCWSHVEVVGFQVRLHLPP